MEVWSKAIRRHGQLIIPGLLFAYVFWFRVHGLEQRFGLYGDQIRDWDIAQRRLTELPLTGVPSTAGGFTVGPGYYWVLWLVAHTIGPSFDRLPHGGGYGLALVHSAADVLLWYALASHWRSAVALAAVLLCATAGSMRPWLGRSGTLQSPKRS